MKKYISSLITLLAFTTSVFAQSNTTIPTNTVTIGKTGAADKTIELNLTKPGAAANPKIKYNNSTAKIQFSNDGTNYRDIGSGGGVDNKISNGDFESQTTGWATYKETDAVTFTDAGDTVGLTAHTLQNGDQVSFTVITSTTGISINTLYYVVGVATNTFQVSATLGGSALALTTNGTGTLVRYIPKTGTGGSADVTLSASSSSPLSGTYSGNFVKGAANYMGQGWSYDFTVDSKDKAKALQISFEYLISSGTFVPGSDTTLSDTTVYLFDVTNSRLIQPSTYKLMSNSSTLSTRFTGTFQTNSDSTSYRLIFHVGSVSASAYTIKPDNVVVAATQYVYGSPSTEWASVTPVFSGFGTATSIECQDRRDGPDYLLRCSFVVGTTAASEARVSLRSGLTTADTTRIPSIQNAGHWFNGASSANHGGAVLVEPSVTYFTFSSGAAFGTGTFNALTKQNGNNMGLTDSTSKVSLVARVPIQGWGASIQMSDSSDTRVVSFSGTTSSTQAVTANVTNITYTAAKDSHGAWGGSSYTAPVPGDYIVAHMRGDNGVTTQNFRVYVNGVLSRQVGGTSVSGARTAGSVTIPNVKAGDIISVRSDQTTTLEATGNISISLISGPTSIAATETITASYYVSANFAASTTTPINYDTREFDSHISCVPSPTVFKCTAPASGLYEIAINAYATTSTNYDLYKNGTINRSLTYVLSSSNAQTAVAKLKLAAGDYIDVRPSGSVTVSGGTLSTHNTNYISFTRIGAF